MIVNDQRSLQSFSKDCHLLITVGSASLHSVIVIRWQFLKNSVIIEGFVVFSFFVGFDGMVDFSSFAVALWMFCKIPPLDHTVSSFVVLVVGRGEARRGVENDVVVVVEDDDDDEEAS